MRTEETIINIIFDAGKGSVTQTSREGTVGSPIGALPTPSRPGYCFEGWYLDQTLVSADTVLQSDCDIRLQARWSRARTKKKPSSLKRQKMAVITLAIVAVLLLVTWAIVAQVISIYYLTDTYTVDGVEYSDRYTIKRRDGVYKMFDSDGNLMPTRANSTEIFIAVGSGNQYQIDPETGDYSLKAFVDPDSLTDFESTEGTILLLFPEIDSSYVYSIEVENEKGSYKFIHTPDRTYVEGYEDALFRYDSELYAQLCFACGWTASTRKLTSASDVAKLADGSIDYAVYGLETPAATFTISSVLFEKDADGKDLYNADGTPKVIYTTKKDENGDEVKLFTPDPEKTYTIELGALTPARDGYYARVQGKESIYIMDATYLGATVLHSLEEMIVPQALHTVSINTHSMAHNFYLKYLNNWTEDTNDGEVIVSFTYEDLAKRQNTLYTTHPYINIGNELMAGYEINASTAVQVMGSLYNMQFVGCTKLGLTAKALREYGLDKNVYYLSYAMDLNADDGLEEYHRNEILISRELNENGNYYIASFTYDMIVEVDPSYLPFMEWDSVDWYEKYFLQINMSYIKEMHLQFGDTSYDMVLDNTKSYAFYEMTTTDDSGKTTTILQAVDTSMGSLYEKDSKLYYRTKSGTTYEIVVVVNFDTAKRISYRDAVLNPSHENVIYVEETYYYTDASGTNVIVTPDYVNTDIVRRDGKFYFVGMLNGQNLNIEVQREYGEPIYRYKEGMETTLMVDSSCLEIYCEQYEKNGGLLDYTLTSSSIDDTGAEKIQSVTALQNFQQLYLALLRYSLEGDVDEKEFYGVKNMTVEDFLATKPEADVTFTIMAHDYASLLNSYTYYDEYDEGHMLYPDNMERNLLVRFYKYSDWKALVTIQTLTKDENGNWVVEQTEEVGKFFVQANYLDQLQKSVEMLINEQIIPS